MTSCEILKFYQFLQCLQTLFLSIYPIAMHKPANTVSHTHTQQPTFAPDKQLNHQTTSLCNQKGNKNETAAGRRLCAAVRTSIASLKDSKMLPLDSQTSSNTLSRLERGKERAGAIKRAGEKLGEEKEFLSTQYVPQPRSNGMTKVVMSLSPN